MGERLRGMQMKRILMDQRFIAVIGVLVLTGLALAFAVAFLVGGDSGRTEDIWLVQNPPLTKTAPLPSGNGSETLLNSPAGNNTSLHPAGTANSSNVSKLTGKIIGQNQSAFLLSIDGKPGPATITLDNPGTGPETLTAEQKDLAEQVALADLRVQDLLGTSMYTVDIQPLRSVAVEGTGGATKGETGASVAFTTINTTTAKNEMTFFVHVDLGTGKVAGISPEFSLS